MISNKELKRRLESNYKFAIEFMKSVPDVSVKDALYLCEHTEDCNWDIPIDGPVIDDLPVKKLNARYFEKVFKVDYDGEIPWEDLKLPFRSTVHSAGYDFVSPISFTLQPEEEKVIALGWLCKMMPDEMLLLMPKSGLGFKYKMRLANTIGLGDADFYNANGEYKVKVCNEGDKVIEIEAGQKIGQAVITKYLTVEGDTLDYGETRVGGFGSTGL